MRFLNMFVGVICIACLAGSMFGCDKEIKEAGRSLPVQSSNDLVNS